MKKVISFFLLTLSFALYAQEASTSSESVQTSQPLEITFNKDSLISEGTPPLVIHRGGLFDVYQYKLLDGTKLSDREVNKLLKQFEKTKLTMKKLTRNKGMQARLMQQMGGMGGGGLGGLGDLSKLAGKFKGF